MSEQEPNPLKSPAGNPAPDAAPADDAGTQALSEALRSSFIIVRIIMFVLVVVFFGSGIFTVDASHKAIILRMGRPVGVGEAALLGPGLHFALPSPIDKVEKIPFTSSQTADSTLGWYLTAQERARGASKPPAQGQMDPNSSSYVLTGDTNIIHVVATVAYHITDPIKFHFDFADAPAIITNDLNNALLFAASHFSVDDALTRQPTAFKEAVTERMVKLVKEQDLGITVDLVSPQTHSPLFLEADFDRVIQATQQRPESVAKAKSYESTVVGNAQSANDSRVKAAEAASARMVSLINAEQTNFSLLLPYYQHSPVLVKSQLLAETLQKVWVNAEQIDVMPDLEGRQIRLHLSPPAAPIFTSTNPPSQ